jgi:prefoldin alpha subunit
MPDTKLDDAVREKYYEYQAAVQQHKVLVQQHEVLEEQIQDIQKTIEALEHLSTMKSGNELLVPISQGVFAHASIKDCDNLLVNVGGEILVKKTLEKTKTMMEERLKAVQEYQQDNLKNLQTLQTAVKSLESELKEMLPPGALG